MKKSASVILVTALTAASAMANIFETNETQRANLKVAETCFKTNALTADGKPDAAKEWRRGLLMSKTDKTVTILAEACDILVGATVEFPLVGELSDRDYESAFRTFAKPGDIAAALEGLGVPRGVNVNSAKMQFWAKGERIRVEVSPYGEKNYRPIEDYLIDKTTGKAPAWNGFVYCGSPDDPESKDGVRLADAVAPNSVISTYNEPQTVLDVPVLSNQSDVYERYVLAKDAPFKPFALYTIRLSPENRQEGVPRVRDMKLAFAEEKGKVIGILREGDLGRGFEIPQLFEKMEKRTADGFDPHVQVSFDENLTVRQAVALAHLLAKGETDGNLRIGPPPAGTFYYKGFMPNESWREAKTRISQPWEAHFTTNAASFRLVQTIEDWSDKNSIDAKLITKEYTVATPEEAVKTITDGDAPLAPNLRLPVILVFAPENAPLSTFMPAVRALLPSHPLVYVFAEKAK